MKWLIWSRKEIDNGGVCVSGFAMSFLIFFCTSLFRSLPYASFFFVGNWQTNKLPWLAWAVKKGKRNEREKKWMGGKVAEMESESGRNCNVIRAKAKEKPESDAQREESESRRGNLISCVMFDGLDPNDGVFVSQTHTHTPTLVQVRSAHPGTGQGAEEGEEQDVHSNASKKYCRRGRCTSHWHVACEYT